MPIEEKAKIIASEQVAQNHFKITFYSPYISSHAEPGQFLHVRCGTGTFPLLRRPISIHNIEKDKNEVQILVKTVGTGTKLLSQLRLGDRIDLLGPLGNGFKINTSKKVAVLVGGGYGIAPLFYLAKELKDKIKAIYAFIGAKSKDSVLCEEDFKGLGVEVVIGTEDGSAGRKCLICEPVNEIFTSKTIEEGTDIFACGPHGMLKELSSIAFEKKIPCQVSMEEKMACGIGTCLGCVTKTKEGYKKVCEDGPVFDSRDIIW